MEPLYNQQGDKGCPDLDAKGVLTGSDKGFYLQVLFQALEEDLDLPTLLVDGTDCGGSKVEMVRQKDNLFLFLFVPHDDTPQWTGVLLPGCGTGQANRFVAQNVPVFGHIVPLCNDVGPDLSKIAFCKN